MVLTISQMYEDEEICKFHIVVGSHSTGICIIETIKEDAAFYERLLPNSQCIAIERLIYILKPKLAYASYPDGFKYEDKRWLEALILKHGISKDSKIWFRFDGEESLTFEDVLNFQSIDGVYLGNNRIGYLFNTETRKIFISPVVKLVETGRVEVNSEDMFKGLSVTI